MNPNLLTVIIIVCIILPVTLVFVLGLFAIIPLMRQKSLEKALLTQGKGASGHIIQHFVDGIGRGTNLYLRYGYTLDGVQYECKQSVSIEEFNSVKDGETVQIMYSLQNPSVSIIVPIDHIHT